MAEKQATPEAVVIIQSSQYQRSVAVGAFARSFELDRGKIGVIRGIKAVWRNETGPSASVHSKGVSL